MKIYTIIILFILFFISSCRKDDDNSIIPNNITPTEISSISDLNLNTDFDFKNGKYINVEIKFPNSLNFNKNYKVQLIDEKTGTVVAKGATNNEGVFKTKCKIKTSVENLIVNSISGNYKLPVTNNSIVFDYNSVYFDDTLQIQKNKNFHNYTFPKNKNTNSVNLLSNGDFALNDFAVGNEVNAKNDLYKWYIMNENDFSHYNNNSIRYYNNGFTVSAEMYQGFNVTPNTDIQISIDLKTSGFNVWSALRVAFYDNNGNSVAYQQVSVSPNNTWNTFIISATVPNNAIKAVFYPIITISGPNAEVLIDNAIAYTLNSEDTDNDGIIDEDDDFPTDNTKAFLTSFPSEDKYGTYAFEDLWPYTGDYDFNDLVLNYNYNYTTNASNMLVSLECKYRIKAVGGSYKNGFGISINKPSNIVGEVTGNYNTQNYINYNSNGTEAGQANAVIIVFDNVFDVISHPGGMGINTTVGNTYVSPVNIKLGIKMNSPVDLSDFNINPFLIKDGNRDYEIHLPYNLPTDLANINLFGEGQDESISIGYYKSEHYLPWVLSIPYDFDYPIEKKDITQAYLKFAEWVQSNGTQYTDWYEDNNGYRNDANIYY